MKWLFFCLSLSSIAGAFLALRSLFVMTGSSAELYTDAEFIEGVSMLVVLTVMGIVFLWVFVQMHKHWINS